MNEHHKKPVLVTGATGYIGGRLVPRLLDAGYHVRCLVREPRKLAGRSWESRAGLEVVKGEASDSLSVERAMNGCGAGYYLIHSMEAAGPAYRRRDRELAATFSRAASRAGLTRIIYLGGLGETGPGLSKHLSSRREVETALAADGVPVTVLRAAMIIGSGSASFEILRYLVERLPVMVTPRWVATECQPIAVRNALQYLVACLENPETSGRTLDIGGPDVHRYSDILQMMARALRLRRRLIVPVPVLTPKLSSLWIHLVTPVSQHLARPLAEGLRNRVVCRDTAAMELMPQQLLTTAEAIDLAVGNAERGQIESSWMDAWPVPGDPEWAGGTVYTDERSTAVSAKPADVYAAVCRVGGKQGWYSADWLWRLRGFLDRLAGGPGLSRGRRRPDRVEFGDALDFWRVVDIDPGVGLRLLAEMKLPGEAELEFRIEPADVEGDRQAAWLHQTARFKPKGLAGLAYWQIVKPLHNFVFERMLRGIKHDAENPFR